MTQTNGFDDDLKLRSGFYPASFLLSLEDLAGLKASGSDLYYAGKAGVLDGFVEAVAKAEAGELAVLQRVARVAREKGVTT